MHNLSSHHIGNFTPCSGSLTPHDRPEIQHPPHLLGSSRISIISRPVASPTAPILSEKATDSLSALVVDRKFRETAVVPIQPQAWEQASTSAFWSQCGLSVGVAVWFCPL